MRTFFGDDGALDYDAVRGYVAQNVQRAFYYNSIDYSAGSNETPEAAARIRAAEARFAQIESVQDLHVRPGVVTAASRDRLGFCSGRTGCFPWHRSSRSLSMMTAAICSRKYTDQCTSLRELR